MREIEIVRPANMNYEEFLSLYPISQGTLFWNDRLDPVASDEELMATIECQQKHDDENTQILSEGANRIVVIPENLRLSVGIASTTGHRMFQPAPQCIQNRMRRNVAVGADIAIKNAVV